MSRKNVFLYDIDVPEIVQEKAEAAFSMIKTEGEITMEEQRKEQKNNRKCSGKELQRGRDTKKSGRVHKKGQTAGILLGAAACAAIAIIAGNFVWNRHAAEIAEKRPDVEGIPASAEKEEDFLSAVDNMFTLQVRAAELEEGQPVPLINDTQASDNDSKINVSQASSWVLGGTEDGGVDYCIKLPLSCVGNNIEKITYSINQGAFQVVQPEGESIIIEGQLYDGELNVGQIGGGYDEETGLSLKAYEVLFYQSFTVDYQKQSDEDTWINICNELSDRQEIADLIWGVGNSLEENNRGMQEMLDDTVITCTVHYTDGTSQSADVLVNSRIMTCAEAGAEAKEDPDREEIFITFELQ